MATKRAAPTDDDETTEEPQAPAEVSEARQKFLIGELTWNEYIEAENQ